MSPVSHLMPRSSSFSSASNLSEISTSWIASSAETFYHPHCQSIGQPISQSASGTAAYSFSLDDTPIQLSAEIFAPALVASPILESAVPLPTVEAPSAPPAQQDAEEAPIVTTRKRKSIGTSSSIEITAPVTSTLEESKPISLVDPPRRTRGRAKDKTVSVAPAKPKTKALPNPKRGKAKQKTTASDVASSTMEPPAQRSAEKDDGEPAVID
ncbi:hypothetical protein HKX48_009073, partial [Thoreauomyces humboldtii]